VKVLCSQGLVSPHRWGSSPVRSLRRRLHPRPYGMCPGVWLPKGGQEGMAGSKAIDFYVLSWGVPRTSACNLIETAQRKSHPLEGSCQEAIPLPSTTFDMFFVVFRSAHATPDWPSQTHPCFHSHGVGSDAPHQSPIRFKASQRLAAEPDVCPWHCACPRKPSVPCRVQSCTTYRYMAPSRVHL
jgi:hypothetical protein